MNSFPPPPSHLGSLKSFLWFSTSFSLWPISSDFLPSTGKFGNFSFSDVWSKIFWVMDFVIGFNVTSSNMFTKDLAFWISGTSMNVFIFSSPFSSPLNSLNFESIIKVGVFGVLFSLVEMTDSWLLERIYKTIANV